MMAMNINIGKLCEDDFFNLLNGNENTIETHGKYKTVFKEMIIDYLKSNNYKCVAINTTTGGKDNQICIGRMFFSKGQFVHLESTGIFRNHNEEVHGEVIVKSENADFMLNLSKYLVEIAENKYGKRGVSDYFELA